MAVTSVPIISADSHITEPPDTYVDRIDRALPRPGARTSCTTTKRGDLFVIDGHATSRSRWGSSPRPASRPRRSRMFGARFEELHRGGWDPEARLADQDRDGVAAEVIYPTVGMVLCNHPRLRLQAGLLRRLQPLDRRVLRRAPRPAARHRPDRDAHAGGGHRATCATIKALGLRGVMMPGNPGGRGLRRPGLRPVLGGGGRARPAALVPHPHEPRGHVQGRAGPKLNALPVDHPRLPGHHRHARLRRRLRAPSRSCSVVCVEADAGWVPHYMYRMDHAYKRHRYWLPRGDAHEAAERVLPRAHLHDVPGRLGRVPGDRPAATRAG